MLNSICQQIWKTQKWPQDWKRSEFIPISKKGNAKECSNYYTIALISLASKVMLQMLQARPQQFVHQELPDVQAGFRKGRRTRDQIANSSWIIEKAREFQKKKKNLLLFHWLWWSLSVWITKKMENSLRDGNTRQLTCVLINLYAGQGATELDKEHCTGLKLEKESNKALYYHSAY